MRIAAVACLVFAFCIVPYEMFCMLFFLHIEFCIIFGSLFGILRSCNFVLFAYCVLHLCILLCWVLHCCTLRFCRFIPSVLHVCTWNDLHIAFLHVVFCNIWPAIWHTCTSKGWRTLSHIPYTRSLTSRLQIRSPEPEALNPEPPGVLGNWTWHRP